MYDGLVDPTVTTITELAIFLFDLLFRQYDPLTCSVLNALCPPESRHPAEDRAAPVYDADRTSGIETARVNASIFSTAMCHRTVHIVSMTGHGIIGDSRSCC